MSHAIDELREHFNRKAVPNSKTLKEERDTVNALIDAVEEENAKLRELVAEIYEDQCDHGDQWRYRDRMRKLGIKF